MSEQRLKIIFMGSPDFACPTLQALLARHTICHVLTQPPRPAGRGMNETKTAVAELAEKNNIPVSWPTSLKDPVIEKQLADMGADLFVVVAYGLLLPKAVLSLPRLGCLNGHASLLPRWRGAAPIQRAIEAGDIETGSCAMMMEEGLDTGPVILCQKTPIHDDDIAASLHDRLADITAATLLEAIDQLANGTAIIQPQNEEGICYAAKIKKSEAAITISDDAREIKNQIHALSPFPGAFIEGASGKRLKWLMAACDDNRTDKPAGTYLGQGADGSLQVACGNGSILSIKRLQPAGRKAMTAADYLRGTSLEKGQNLQAQI